MLLYGTTDLTSKEWATTALVAAGLKNNEIAIELHYASEHVVKNQLRRIFDKTGTWNRTELALWYITLGIEKEKRAFDRRENCPPPEVERRKHDRRQLPATGVHATKARRIVVNE